ncbi:MAG: MFS transporter [Pseudomonadota bacterium]
MNEFREGWGPLLAATVGTMCGLITVTNYSQGFFVAPVITEFGWTTAQFFLSFTIMMCVGLLTGPMIGSLAGRIGVRQIGIIGLIGHALAYVLISLNNGSLLLWYVSFALLAILGAGSLPIIWTSALNGWFKVHRGKAIGITMAGTGIGAFLLPPIVDFIIENYGWRTAYRSVGVGALLLSLPVVMLLFREKAESTEAPGPNAPVASWGMTRSEAIRTGRFWILGAVLFVTALVIVGLLSNFERILTERGLARSEIAILAAILGLTVIFGRLLVGTLVDRFWAPAVAVCFVALPTMGLVILNSTEVTFAIAIVVAVLFGLAAGAELDLLAYLTGKYFGPAHYPAVFGGIFAFFTVGAGVAPPIYGAAAQAFNGYTAVLTASIGLFVLSMLLYLALGRYPQHD